MGYSQDGHRVTVFYDTDEKYAESPYAATVKRQRVVGTVHAVSIDGLDAALQQLYGFGLTPEARDFLATQGG